MFLSNVERIDVLNGADTDLDLDASSWNGVTTYAVNNGNASTYVYNIREAFTTVGYTNFGTGSSADADLDLTVTDDVFSGADNSLTVNLNRAGSDANSDYVNLYLQNNSGDNVIEHMVINSVTASAGDENYFWYNDSSDSLKTITVTGTAGVASN